MYRIKQAAARSGVSEELLRAWERRYGVVHPHRTDGGYRLYDEEAIARLRAMRRLIDEGWSPSAASTFLGTADDDRVRELASGAGGTSEPAAPSATPAATASGAGEGVDAASLEDLPVEFVAAAEALDAVRVEAVLDRMFAVGSFEFVADHLLRPALRGIGEAWTAGRMEIAAEHAATHAVLRRLGAAFQAAGRPGRDAPVLVGLPPGSRHELGALAFAIAARRAGLPVFYVGADLPANDWVDAARTLGARAAVVGVVTLMDQAAGRLVVEALRDSHPDLVIAVGGGGAEFAGLDSAVIRLPSQLPDAVDALQAALGSARRASGG